MGYYKYLMPPFTSAVRKHLPGTVPGTRHAAVIKTGPCPHGAYGLTEETGIYATVGWGVHWEGWGVVGAGKGQLAIHPHSCLEHSSVLFHFPSQEMELRW